MVFTILFANIFVYFASCVLPLAHKITFRERQQQEQQQKFSESEKNSMAWWRNRVNVIALHKKIRVKNESSAVALK